MNQRTQDAARPETAITVEGVLVTTLEVQRYLSRYEPLDYVWVFRRADTWTLLILRRAERWSDDGQLISGSARVSVESVTTLDAVRQAFRELYGESGWRCLLDVAHTEDPDMFRSWVPVQLERDLDRAVLFRPNLAAQPEKFTADELSGLREELAHHLSAAGFDVVGIRPPRRPTRRGENLVMAEAVVRRYGHEATAIVRMDSVGEIYTRIVEEDDIVGPAIHEVDDDDG